MGIQKLIQAAAKLTGSSARVTMGKTQILKAVGKESPKAAEELTKVFNKMKNPKVTLAYKASENGYTVGAFALRDGKKVIANGAGSVTGLGTENAVLKMRFNAGKNGEIFSYSGFNDLAHTPRIQDINSTASLNNGVYELTSRIGNYGGGRVRLDIPKAVESFGLKEEGALITKKVNKVLENGTQIIRDTLAGKPTVLG